MGLLLGGSELELGKISLESRNDYIKLGKYEEAKQELNLAIEDFNNAIETFNKEIKLNIRFGSAYFLRGITFMKLKKYDYAILDFTMAINLNTDKQNAYKNRGLAHAFSKEYSKALQDFSEAIKLKPTSVAYTNIGAVYINLSDYPKAIEELSKGINLIPVSEEAFLNRGYAYFYSGQYEKAKEDFVSALDLERNYKTLLSLALVCSSSGDTLAVKKYIEDAIRNEKRFENGISSFKELQIEEDSFSVVDQFLYNHKTELNILLNLLENRLHPQV
ncbi:MAG: tetratricopeptide repeat protein [Ignavibacteria bacterium]|nr:tetratricopeptide repeat protein [Ignavibacteria bacterium]